MVTMYAVPNHHTVKILPHAHVAEGPLQACEDRPLGQVRAIAAEALADQDRHGLSHAHHGQQGDHVQPQGQGRGSRRGFSEPYHMLHEDVETYPAVT